MKTHAKRGTIIGLVIGIIMTILLAVSYTDFFSNIGAYQSVLTIILIPYLLPFSVIMLLLDNASCSIKNSTDCTGEIVLAMIVTTILFTCVGYMIGLIIDKAKQE